MMAYEIYAQIDNFDMYGFVIYMKKEKQAYAYLFYAVIMKRLNFSSNIFLVAQRRFNCRWIL